MPPLLFRFRTQLCAISLLGSFCAMAVAGPQTPSRLTPPPAPKAASASRVPIDTYIGSSWPALQRSMSDCTSLVDPKTRTTPVLYLPFGMQEPAAVSKLKAACGVRVLHLPRRIDHPGALMPSEIPTPGLLYLPHPYVVPGGRFNEQYGWDTFFILLGLLETHQVGGAHLDLARGIVENFFFEIENYGNLLNANRTYYLTRSQPPLLSSMIRLIYDAMAETTGGAKASGEAESNAADAWLATAYRYAERDHAFWLSPEHAAGDTGLARYHDLGAGPVPEMADDSTYYPDIVRWLLDHPEVKTGYLVEGPAIAPQTEPTAAQAAAIRRISCNPAGSYVCVHAHVGSYWLSPAFYQGDRAMRESGFDTSFRWGPFAGSTEQYAPVGLNALLYKYELDLAWMADRLRKPADSARWKGEAAARKAAMNKYLWSARAGMYMDWNYVTHTQSTYAFLTTFYPLWAGAADPAQARSVEAHLPLFLQPGGVAASTYQSGVQWDLPYGWAPLTYFTVAGLARFGDGKDAATVAERFMQSVRNEYTHDGTIREKYNVVRSNANVHVLNGYRQNVIGFGWTNGVYLRLGRLLAGEQAGAALGVTP